jgi:hypothetical protein
VSTATPRLQSQEGHWWRSDENVMSMLCVLGLPTQSAC